MHARYEPDEFACRVEQTLNQETLEPVSTFPVCLRRISTLTRPRFPARPQQECRNRRMPGISDQAACESYELHIS